MLFTELKGLAVSSEANMSDIKVGVITLGMCATNTYYIFREGSSQVVLVDPADEGAKINKALEEQGLKVVAILLTHGHFDHTWGVEEIVNATGAKVYASEDEKDFLADTDSNLSAMYNRPCVVKPDYILKDYDIFEEAGIAFKMIKTPGHTEGSCCYYVEEEQLLFSGDTLFQESVGRCDLPTGSMSAIVRSIKDKLMLLEDGTKVLPGHGSYTTIGYERIHNPYL